MKRPAALALLAIVLALPLASQEIRIASYNMDRLGEGKKDYVTLARVIANFDVVAALEVMNEAGMERVHRSLGKAWTYAIGEKSSGSKAYREYAGFFWDDKVELVKLLGAYPARKEFFRAPLGARFRVKASGFTFTLVACHIVYGKSAKARDLEINRLGKVYRYFEGLTGNAGTTIIAGDFNEERMADFASLVDLGDEDVLPVKGTTLGMRGPGKGYDHLFVSARLKPRVTKADVFYWTDDFAGTRRTVSDHFPVYCVMRSER
jgi:endonuclease/exonuclease/phosphatase family metal-dependent hydrolase